MSNAETKAEFKKLTQELKEIDDQIQILKEQKMKKEIQMQDVMRKLNSSLGMRRKVPVKIIDKRVWLK